MALPDWLQPIESVKRLRLDWLARCLSHVHRYGGRSPIAINLAHHSLLVERLLPQDASVMARRLALAHDIHELWTGDVPRPICEELGDAFEQIKSRHDAHIFGLLGITPTALDVAMVRRADKQAARLEIAFGEGAHPGGVWPHGDSEFEWRHRWLDLKFSEPSVYCFVCDDHRTFAYGLCTGCGNRVDAMPANKSEERSVKCPKCTDGVLHSPNSAAAFSCEICGYSCGRRSDAAVHAAFYRQET